MQNEKSIKVHQEILKAFDPKYSETTEINSQIYYRFDEINNLRKWNEWGGVDKNFKEFVADKILKICMENKFIYITGTSILPDENDNVVSFSAWDRGSVEISKEEMQIYRYALKKGIKATRKGTIFNCGNRCFNPHDLEFPEKYQKNGWNRNYTKETFLT
jgi:hypothetical protein